MVFNVRRATLAYSETHTGTIDIFEPNSAFTSLDSNLQNLPKLYVEKLLEITSSNEHFIADYRTYLCSKAKSIQGCPMGNLTARTQQKTIQVLINTQKTSLPSKYFATVIMHI